MCDIFTNKYQVDFELIGELGVTIGGAQKRERKHNICDYNFWQQINKGNNTWHTGTWRKKLQTISNGKSKSAAGNIEDQAHSRYIIYKKESNTIAIVPPVEGVSFLPLRRILSTISMRQLVSFLLVYHYNSMGILMLRPG